MYYADPPVDLINQNHLIFLEEELNGIFILFFGISRIFESHDILYLKRSKFKNSPELLKNSSIITLIHEFMS